MPIAPDLYLSKFSQFTNSLFHSHLSLITRSTTQEPKSDSEANDNPQSNDDLSGPSDDDSEGQAENEAPEIRSSPSIPDSSVAGFGHEYYIALISYGKVLY